MVHHSMGETCVPLMPQRVIALDSVGNALALGIVPVGSWIDPHVSSYLKDKVSGIEHIFSAGSPNLEKILTLNPDLILGSSYQRAIYEQLTQIAPTILAEYQTNEDWKRVLMKQAEALGKLQKAEQIMSDYDARVTQFKTRMGDNLKQIKVSVARIYPEGFALYTNDGFASTILRDAGLNYPSLQDRYRNAIVSRERIQDIDADVVFIWSYSNSAAINQETQSTLKQLKNDPLWLQLHAVQQGRVYKVPSYWIGDSILEANAIVDDLFKYLVEAERELKR
ncbi:ABC transporter substrate-binding protein [Gloeocapsa sp. PCC 7428]|uniref:ABC transporter substrate-binding protein n=1 Tax=Gloeocapsa sp. PCC 7428 TaxID=1173026 RepID=UPI001E3FF794|nr:iron-siderophore ABC transporter substrate-binding protein [Gloeocapsa sp. PCC 7428]